MKVVGSSSHQISSCETPTNLGQATMTLTRAWLLIFATGTVLSLMLLWIGTLQYATAPVMPPRPVADYTSRVVLSRVALLAIVVMGVVTAALAARNTPLRGRVVAIGCACMITIAAVLGAMAFIST